MNANNSRRVGTRMGLNYDLTFYKGQKKGPLCRDPFWLSDIRQLLLVSWLEAHDRGFYKVASSSAITIRHRYINIAIRSLPYITDST